MITLVVLSLASALAMHLAVRSSAAAASRRRLPVEDEAVERTAGWLDAALAEAAIPTPASVVQQAWAIAAATLVVGALVAGGAVLAAVVAIASALAPPMALRLGRHRRGRATEASLPDALDAMARSLRSGGSLRHALEETASATTGPLGEDLDRVARDLRDGVALGDSLERWSDERPLPGVRLAASALALGAETGGATARAVDGVAETLRTNVAITAEVRALSSQARLSALVIAVAPLGFTLLAGVSDGRTATFLLRTPIGVACLCAGLALDLAGGLWMRALTAIDV